MASGTKFHQTIEDLFHGVHNLGSDTIKVALTNTAPTASTDATFSDISEISDGNGYTAGGTATTISSSGQTSGTYKLVITDVTFTASGGSIGPFRYAVAYNDTPTSPADPLLAVYDAGSEVTLSNGESFTTDFDGSGGFITGS